MYIYMRMYIYIPTSSRIVGETVFMQNRGVRKVHNERNVGSVYVSGENKRTLGRPKVNYSINELTNAFFHSIIHELIKRRRF